jgi:hypothetical protein
MSYRSREAAPQSSNFPADVLVALMIVLPLATGFAVTAIAKGQSYNANTAGSWPAISCVNASTSYPEGTVIEYPRGRALWVRTAMPCANGTKQWSQFRERPSPSLAMPCPPPRPMVALAKSTENLERS